MKKKVIAAVIILTVLPVILLTVLGVFAYRLEEERRKEEIETIGRERLKTVELQIESYFRELEKKLLRLPDFHEMDTDSIRSYMRGDSSGGLIRHIFVIGTGNSLQYPPPEGPLSEKERDFITRTKEIGLGRGLFIGEGNGSVGAAEDFEGAQSNNLRLAGYGWHTWYLGDGVNFIFWRRFEPDIIVGVELNRMAVISEIIRMLPSTESNEGSGQFRVTMLDVQDRPVYMWGNYSPEEGIDAEVEVPAPFPLSSWRLYYQIPVGSGRAGIGRYFPVFGSIIFVFIAVIGLALFLFRESSREIREAYQKVSFVNQVSHELKTPLTNIRMYAELLSGSFEGPEAKESRYLNVVISESRRLSRLISNVLTFAKGQRKGVVLSPVRTPIDDIIRNTVSNFSLSLDSKGIAVELDLHTSEPVNVDRDVIEQIVSNCISNVEKYAASGNYLRIASRYFEKGTIEILITDRGPGIPKNQHEKVFAPFYRISNKASDGVAGTGIGLSIVRSLTRLHGGDAEISSTKRGAAVRITIKGLPEKGGTDENTAG